jgi:hypothetical protein
MEALYSLLGPGLVNKPKIYWSVYEVTIVLYISNQGFSDGDVNDFLIVPTALRKGSAFILF